MTVIFKNYGRMLIAYVTAALLGTLRLDFLVRPLHSRPFELLQLLVEVVLVELVFLQLRRHGVCIAEEGYFGLASLIIIG